MPQRTPTPAEFDRLPEAASALEAWLRDEALPVWSTAGVDAGRGSFHESLTPDGRPAGEQRRARVQSRQVWVFATAALSGFGDGYADVARRGVEFYRRHYLAHTGLFARNADAEGVVTDPVATLYEQAFSLLALSAMERLDGGYRRQARLLRDAMKPMRHDRGGWREAGEQPFQANAHMHLLEAALAWEGAGDPTWAVEADEIVRLALTRFIDPASGVVREFFDADWRALPEAAGGLIEPGHQFEWAWLLEEWGLSRGDARARAAARRLYAAGARGVDGARNVAVGATWGDFSVREPLARLWAQTERLRAAARFGLEHEALDAARGLVRFLETPAQGVWRDKMQADGSFVDEPAPATSLYHLMSGLLPLLGSTR